MEQQLRTILDETAGLSVPASEIGEDQDLFALGLTSFATVTVMLAIEDGFDIEFPDQLLNRTTFRTVGTLMGAIRELHGDGLAA